MTNFKCFREKELNLDEDIITIRGRNGAGKTTIADAILFCLFGKNSEGQSDLELFKTRENGQVVHNLDCSVEIRLALFRKEDGAENQTVTLRRSIKEVWIKKRGSEESVFKNNTVEYFVNGESYTKTDYEKYKEDDKYRNRALHACRIVLDGIIDSKFVMSVDWENIFLGAYNDYGKTGNKG
jgi:DNA repair exonuclease SbcCD ATPase subunit